MANFWKLGAMVWCLTVIGWLVSPVISFLVNKLLSYLDFDISRKLRELELHTIPVLKLTLADVIEQRMLIEEKDEGMGSGSDLITLREVGKDLKSALHEAEDILDLIEYHRTEKKVIGDGKSHGTLHNAVGACIAFCQRSWLGRRIEVHRAKLWQCPQSLNQQFSVLRAKLLHCAQSLKQQFSGHIEQGSVPDVLLKSASSAPESTVDIEHESATQPHTAPDAPSNSAGSTTEFRGDNEHGSVTQAPMPDALSNPQMLDSSSNSLVQMIRGWSGHLNITSCYQSISVGLKVLYSLLCSYRDWSYEAIGIQVTSFTCPIPAARTNIYVLKKFTFFSFCSTLSTK
ncbi:hypothetical protein E2562_006069 [Oryza meyeriana var. granulata]|uniref:Rx N-terminal domain-containing protein n=1 Tax=Oryza meyeriana var. granulata TaxID=110450 RepID=A0A6G1EVJ7_9ORYZ|nr:hypothetical protein E2562_006069 [Oryza meyeriana var. granulata]